VHKRLPKNTKLQELDEDKEDDEDEENAFKRTADAAGVGANVDRDSRRIPLFNQDENDELMALIEEAQKL